MKKSSIIWLSILFGALLIAGLLFGVVFCPRNQHVTVLGKGKIDFSKQAIIKTANIKKTKSIFLIDKQQAINNIEQTYPNVKVVHIKTTGLNTIDIQVRLRYEMFYMQVEDNYYILDEDLKVLEIRSAEDIITHPINDLIQITEGLTNISTSTKICDFVGDGWQSGATRNMYLGMVSAVEKTEGSEEVYFDRDDVKETIKEVKFDQFDTFNKVILTTKYGVKLDIENPNEDMTYKINACFTLINTFIENESGEHLDKEKSGTIKIFYNLEDKIQMQYIAD